MVMMKGPVGEVVGAGVWVELAHEEGVEGWIHVRDHRLVAACGGVGLGVAGDRAIGRDLDVLCVECLPSGGTVSAVRP